MEGAADERPLRGSWVQIYKPSLISKVRTAAQGSRLFMDHESTSLQAHQLEPEDVYHAAERQKKRVLSGVGMSGKNVRRTCSSAISMFGGIIHHRFFPSSSSTQSILALYPFSVIVVPYIPSLCPIALMLMALAIARSVSTLSEC